MNRNIEKLITTLEGIEGENAVISISHKLYGEQKLQCIFNPIIDERIGFNVKGHEIYINKTDIIRVNIGNIVCFSDDLMKIRIEV